MIVTVNAAAGTSKVNYGQISMLVADDGTIEVPAYLGKSLITLAGFTCSADLTPSFSALIGAGEAWEANYLFQAYSKPVPAEDEITAAQALITARGAPAVSAA